MSDTAAENRTVLKKLLVITVVMFGFGFAMVPFYKKICDVTGLSRDRIAVTNTQVDPTRWVTIEFDANVRGGLDWTFAPTVTSLKMHPGEVKTVMYRAKNLTDRTVVAQAIPSYGPAQAVLYFKKIECFCFSQQTLKPHEERLMPVQFVVQNDLPTDIHTITLSYSFWEQHPQTAAAPQASGA